MQRHSERADGGNSPARRPAACADGSLPENPAQFLALLRENSESSTGTLIDCLGLARWTLAAATSLIDSRDCVEKVCAEESPENEQVHALLGTADLLRSKVEERCKARLGKRCLDGKCCEDGGNKELHGLDGEIAGEKGGCSPVSRTVMKRIEEQAAGENEAARALLDFGRRVSAEESLQSDPARPEAHVLQDKAVASEGPDRSGPAVKKPRQHRKVSADSNYEPYSIPVYMPMRNMMCDPLLSGAASALPYPCYTHPAEELMAYARASQHHPFAARPYSAMPFGLPPQHPPPPQPAVHAATAPSPSVPPLPTAAALSPQVYMPMMPAADPRQDGVATALKTSASNHAQEKTSTLSTSRSAAAKRKRLRFPEQWAGNRSVHGSRYVYEGRSCRLQWEQDGKTFGFECYEQLRCKFFDGRFSTIATGDIVQLQDSRIYVLLGTARDVVPRNHQYDTWMICYNFAAYRGMEVVFVELKWLQSVLTDGDELPPDHPDVSLSQVEDALERFTKHPAFHRRHSVAAPRFRTAARNHRGRSGSKTSDEEDGQEGY